MADAHANKVLALQHLRVGWVNCRLRRRVEVKRFKGTVTLKGLWKLLHWKVQGSYYTGRFKEATTLEGSRKLLHWKAVISLRYDEFTLYWGGNEREVLKRFTDKNPVFKFYIFDWPKFIINIDPHKKTCFGIVTSKDYILNVTEKLGMPDYSLVYFLGLCLFVYGRDYFMLDIEYIFFGAWLIFIPLMLYVSLSLTPDPHQDDMGNAFLKFHPIFLYWHKLLWDDLSEFIIEYLE
ncbi:uncharacterized protein LOC128998979 [Macrosteles quadrilineatus]|uniref:uncharacterized protein LOC128998979 n=1 Tax=Macrosteles quadrilineatus TaxID=74068 RepID=UPI0023E124E8|nr:uncharacterized protein LOC128998979 [Macrosteles quadrilineatus]